MTFPLRAVRVFHYFQLKHSSRSWFYTPISFSGTASYRNTDTRTFKNSAGNKAIPSHQSLCIAGPLIGGTISPVLQILRGMAGHSHWQNIRHGKAIQDKIICQTRIKFKQLIKSAIQTGGGADPKYNTTLAKLIGQAEQEDVPKKVIKDMIESAEQTKDAGLLDIEVLGPAGSVFMVQVNAKNAKTATLLVGSAIKKVRGTLSTSRMANHVFDHKGVVTVDVPEEGNIDMDKYLEVAIEVGAEDVIALETKTGQPVLQFHCGVKYLTTVQKNLEEEGLKILSASPEYIPLSWCTLSGQELETSEVLLKKLYSIPEVEAVFDNVTPPEE